MPNKIDELLENEKWAKENHVKKKIGHEEAERWKEEGEHKGEGFATNVEAFKNPATEASDRFRTSSLNYWKLGHTGPKPWFDSWPQGGNAHPRRRRREPSGHYNCGGY